MVSIMDLQKGKYLLVLPPLAKVGHEVLYRGRIEDNLSRYFPHEFIGRDLTFKDGVISYRIREDGFQVKRTSEIKLDIIVPMPDSSGRFFFSVLFTPYDAILYPEFSEKLEKRLNFLKEIKEAGL